MVISTCTHSEFKNIGCNRNGSRRFRCKLCGQSWTEERAKPLGDMRVSLDDAKLALRMLLQGMSINATERVTGLHGDTIGKLVLLFGDKCREFLDKRMRGLTLDHLQVDEQYTYVAKKQSRLTIEERAERHDIGEMYLWIALDQKTKLVPCFRLGKRTGDNARRFLVDLSRRLIRPNAHASDAHGFATGGYQYVTQISTDGFAAYPEAVDLAFGPYARFGTIIKQYRNAKMEYTPSEMIGTKRTGRRGIGKKQEWSICTSHVERFNGTTRTLVKRFCRLTLAFSKKLECLEAAVAMHLAAYNYCWQTRKPGNTSKKRPTAAMMAGLADHVWSFDELFDAVMGG